MFDISSLSASDTIEIEIDDPRTGEPLIGDGGKPCSVTVHSPGSKPFAAAQSRASARAIKRLRAKGRIDTTPEEEQAARATFLTEITISFNHFSFRGGDATSPETFRACYSEPAMGWLALKVNDGAGDWGNALTSASTN